MDISDDRTGSMIGLHIIAIHGGVLKPEEDKPTAPLSKRRPEHLAVEK